LVWFVITICLKQLMDFVGLSIASNIAGNRNGRPYDHRRVPTFRAAPGAETTVPFGGAEKLMHCRALTINAIAADQQTAPGRASGTTRSCT